MFGCGDAKPQTVDSTLLNIMGGSPLSFSHPSDWTTTGIPADQSGTPYGLGVEHLKNPVLP